MKILELQMKNFGKFSNMVLPFHSGINIFRGDNEAGKSTIHAFIIAMMFGIERQRGIAARTDEYKLRQPWDNPTHFAGVMRFESGGKVFRLERNFEQQRKSAVLVCETDGEELSVENGDLDVLLEGMNATSFCNTFFIRQKGSTTEEELADELRNYMNNLQSAGHGEIDIHAAMEALDTNRRKVETDKKQRQTQARTEQNEIWNKIRYEQEGLDRLKGEEAQWVAQKNHLMEEKGQRRESYENERDIRQRNLHGKTRILRRTIPAVFLILSLLLLLITHDMKLRVIALVISVLMVAWLASTWRKQKEEFEEESVAEDRLKRTDQALDKVNWQLERILAEIREKEIFIENLKEDIQEKEVFDDSHHKMEISALKLALDTMKEASAEVHQKWGGKLNDRVSEILEEITEGRYTSIFLDDELNIRINTPEKLLGIWQVSGGTMEQVYFALRMAAGEMMLDGEHMPLILDETFVMYDRARLKQTLSWLRKSEKQVLLFSCHAREGEILKEMQSQKVGDTIKIQ